MALFVTSSVIVALLTLTSAYQPCRTPESKFYIVITPAVWSSDNEEVLNLTLCINFPCFLLAV